MNYGTGGSAGKIAAGVGAGALLPKVLPATGSGMLGYFIIVAFAVLVVFGTALVLRRLKPIK